MATSPADADRIAALEESVELLRDTVADVTDEADRVVAQLARLLAEVDGPELDPDAAAALAAELADQLTRAQLDELAEGFGLDPTPYGTKAQLAAALVDADPAAAGEVVA